MKAPGSKTIIVLLLLLLLLPASRAADRNPEKTVRIGVLAKRGPERCMAKWGPTAEYLTREIPGHKFVIVPLVFDEILTAVKEGNVDFVHANSAFYVKLEKLYGANRVATLKNKLGDDAFTTFGGVIFCRADKDDIKETADLRGKKFMAVDPMSFGGWLMGWRELKGNGIDPHRDFTALRFGGTHDAVVYAVLNGEADAGTVRTDTLERMADEGKIRLDDFRVIQVYDGEAGQLPLLISTREYPEWPLADVRHTTDELAETVAVELVSMPADTEAARAARCAGWTVPHNYQPVHECLKELRVGPYRDFGKVTPADVVRNYWTWLLTIAAFLAALIIAIFHMARLNRNIKRAKEILRNSEAQKKAILDGITTNIAFVNEKLEILWANKAAALSVNKTPEEMIGHKCHEFWADPEEPCDGCPAIKVVRTRNTEQTTMVFPDGRVWDEIGEPVFDDEGKIIGVVEIAHDITERKRAEERLTRLNKCFLSLGPDPMKNIKTITYTAGEILGGACMLYNRLEKGRGLLCTWGIWHEPEGYNPEDNPKGHICYDVIMHGKEGPLIIEDLTGTKYEKIDPNVRKYKLKSYLGYPVRQGGEVVGSFCLCDVKKRKFTDAEIKIVSMLGQALAIEEERIMAEKTLAKEIRKLEEHSHILNIMTGQMTDMVYYKDKNFRYIFSSKPYCDRILKCSQEECVGLTDVEIARRYRESGHEQGFGEICFNSDHQTRDAGKPSKFLETARVDGKEICLEVHKTPIYDEKGEFAGIVGCSRDVTERKEREHHITQLSNALANLSETVIITGLNRTITYANAATEKILGYKPEELIGHSSMEFFEDIPGNPPNLAQKVEREAVNGVWRGEVFSRRKDGSIISVYLTLNLLKDMEGATIGCIGITMDVSERKNLEEQLRHAQKLEAVGTLAGGIAHDFNNILAGIIGYNSLMEKAVPKDSPMREDLNAIKRLSWRGADLTQALLTFSRRGKYLPEPVNINRIIREVRQVIKRTAGKSIEIETELPTETLHVHGDRGQLHQIIMNLCLNACEAMPEGGTLAVRTENAEQGENFFALHPNLKNRRYVSVIVSDTGTGMDEKTRERIFEPFFSTKTDKTGTGLGLSIVSGIVERHGGCIEAESTPGSGTTFTVCMPATKKKERSALKRDVVTLGGDETILVVDDDDDFRASTVRQLTGLGYTVLEAANGEEALNALEKKKDVVNLVVLDMIMKGMGGAKTFGKIKELRPELPVIICTGYSHHSSSQQLIEGGAREFIAKPFDQNSLALKIRKALEQG